MAESDIVSEFGESSLAECKGITSAPSKKEQEWMRRCELYQALFLAWSKSQIIKPEPISTRCYHRAGKVFSATTKREIRAVEDQSPRCFKISGEVVLATANHTIRELAGVLDLGNDCSPGQMAETMKILLDAEETHQAIELCKYRTCNKWIHIEEKYVSGYRPHYQRRQKLYWYGLKVPGLQNRSPAIMPSDYLVLESDQKKFILQIASIHYDQIRLHKRGFDKFKTELRKPLTINFVSSGIPFKFCQAAIAQFKCDSVVQDVVFEDRGSPRQWIKLKMEMEMEDLDARLAALNGPQREAVVGIIQAECRPKPYILFGPPGTGKSHTLVEAVVQVYKRSSRRIESVKILVCVNSNTCTDVIYERIREGLPGVKLVRLRAGDRPVNSYDYDILVTTNVKAGCLSELNKNKFDWIFVDEAGHANLPESLLPIGCLKGDGCLVLAGDPKQLGPVVMCQEAGELGLNTSLLERLFKFDIYQRDPETRSYNSKYITMLGDCYRCDERILAASNKLFYHGDLRCVNATPRGFMRLMGLTSPVQLLHVDGTQTKPEWSTSWKNEEKIEACVQIVLALYKKGIEPDQIGITSPYKLQSKEIHKRLRDALRRELDLLDNRFPEYKYSKKIWFDEDAYIETGVINDVDILKKSLYKKIDGQALNGEVVDHYVSFNMPDYPKDPVTLYKRYERAKDWMCKVDSIDAFQGNEKEIMIISTVRTDESVGRLEFLNDARRFNVAASRAKWLVVLVGKSEVLGLGKYWPHLKAEAKSEIDDWLRPIPEMRPAEL